MVEIRMQVPDNLAQRLQPMYDWLPTVLELSLIGFKTLAVQTTSEIIEFLAKGPQRVGHLRELGRPIQARTHAPGGR